MALDIFLKTECNEVYWLQYNQNLYLDGSSSINFTCGVCCTQFDGEMCPLQEDEIYLEIVKHSEINLTDYHLGWTPDTCAYSLVLCTNCDQNYSIASLLMFEGFNGSYNHFSVMPCFSQWSNLKWIDLSKNRIKYLVTPFFFGMILF